MYSGRMDVTMATLDGALHAATYLQMKPVIIKILVDFTLQNLCVETCVDILLMGDLYALKHLEKESLRYIVHNFQNVVKTEKFLSLSFEKLQSILTGEKCVQIDSVLTEDGCVPKDPLQCGSEYDLYVALLEWVMFDLDARSDHMVDLMGHVRFPLMTSEELEQVSENKLFISYPSCMKAIQESQEFQRLPDQLAKMNVRNYPRIISFGGNIDAQQTTSAMFILDRTMIRRYPEDYPRMFEYQWLELGQTPIPFTTGSRVVTANNYMYVCGGYTDNFQLSNRVFRYDPRFQIWSELDSLSIARAHHCFVALDDKLYVIGGYVEEGDGSLLPSKLVEIYNIEKSKWGKGPSIPYKGADISGFVEDGKLYITGGKDEHGDPLPHLHCINPQLRRWKRLCSMPKATGQHVLVGLWSNLYVLDSVRGNTMQYKIETDQWVSSRTRSCLVSGLSSTVTMFDELYFMSASHRGTNHQTGVLDLNNLEDQFSEYCFRATESIITPYPEPVTLPCCTAISLPQAVISKLRYELELHSPLTNSSGSSNGPNSPSSS